MLFCHDMATLSGYWQKSVAHVLAKSKKRSADPNLGMRLLVGACVVKR